MFTVHMLEAFGPFCGQGGYATCTATVMSRSVKRALRHARRLIGQQPQGGMVPILASLVIMRGREVIYESARYAWRGK